MGLTFAVSGNYKNITRQKLEEFIDKCKGKIHYSVSKKTHFLVLGHILEDGRQPEEGMKYKKAAQFGTTIYREAEFERFCKKRLRNPDFILGRTKELILGDANAVNDEPAENEVDKINDISDHVEGDTNQNDK